MLELFEENEAALKAAGSTMFGEPRVSGRQELLTEALAVVEERNKTYDDPSLDFKRIAAMWTAMFIEQGYEFGPDDVAKMLICLKLSRLMSTRNHKDSWLDIAGYGACGWEVVNDNHT